MSHRDLRSLFVVAVLSATAATAQNRGFLFTGSQTETTQSGSAGTVLQTLRPNEVTSVDFFPCPVISAEKWAPVTAYNTMAGDDDADTFYFNPAMFGSIDALLDMPSPVGCPSQRSVFYSPSVTLGTNISGTPGLRPGDTGRIVRAGTNDGQIEYFLTAENVQIALGMPPAPILVDVDAIAADPTYGVFFSLDGTHTVAAACGVTTVQDGDLLMIPAASITWTTDFRVAAVVPGDAQVVFDEAQMDLIVQNAGITDRFGTCVTAIADLESLDIDYSGPVFPRATCTGTAYSLPTFRFSGALMTGAGLCTTLSGGQIDNGPCGPLGSACGTALPTLGNQLGLDPTSTTVGVPSFVNALTTSFFDRWVIEPQQHVVTSPTTVSIDSYSPHPANIIFVKIAPASVSPSFSFFNCGFPDVYFFPSVWWGSPATGFDTITTPTINVPVKLVAQGIALTTGGQLVLSSPASIDVQ